MWNQILGHTEQIATLRALLAHQRLPQCLLLAGPDGIGKRLLARTIMQAFFCRAGADEPCGQCADCLQIAAQHHPDGIWIERTPSPTTKKLRAEIVIDQIRALRAHLSLTTMSGHGKIAVIDDADCLNPHAANSCLKLLEEPTDHTHLILLTARPQDLLPTIRSRCQALSLAPLPLPLLTQHLAATGLDPATARQRALMSNGSLATALAYPTELLTETIQDLHALPHTTAADLLNMAERWAQDDHTCGLRLYILALLWRDVSATQCGAAQTSIPATAALRDALAVRQPSRIQRELRDIFAALRSFEDASANKQLCCESLLFSLAA